MNIGYIYVDKKRANLSRYHKQSVPSSDPTAAYRREKQRKGAAHCLGNAKVSHEHRRSLTVINSKCLGTTAAVCFLRKSMDIFPCNGTTIGTRCAHALCHIDSIYSLILTNSDRSRLQNFKRAIERGISFESYTEEQLSQFNHSFSMSTGVQWPNVQHRLRR